jgi:hypothetical protein
LKKLRFILTRTFNLTEGESLVGKDHPVRLILGENGTLIQIDIPGDAPRSGRKRKGLPESIVESTGITSASAGAGAGAGAGASVKAKVSFFEFFNPGHAQHKIAHQFHSFIGKQANIFVSLADDSWVYS